MTNMPEAADGSTEMPSAMASLAGIRAYLDNQAAALTADGDAVPDYPDVDGARGEVEQLQDGLAQLQKLVEKQRRHIVILEEAVRQLLVLVPPESLATPAAQPAQTPHPFFG
ncbi:hypothetical protein [Streptacidiphilus cavernicola]|uniref:Uncharacterized protein n=1 Tax=Streptacidiphilus cavernicola TaxID=3342716 RepID=A0ABV6VNY0_9ACTN